MSRSPPFCAFVDLLGAVRAPRLTFNRARTVYHAKHALCVCVGGGGRYGYNTAVLNGAIVEHAAGSVLNDIELSVPEQVSCCKRSRPCRLALPSHSFRGLCELTRRRSLQG